MDAFLAAADKPFLSRAGGRPTDARFYDAIDREYRITPGERQKLAENGFVVSDRVAFPDFTTAYAHMYWKDLPVLITTDSLLQAVHHTYDELLSRMERSVLTASLAGLLARIREQVRTDAEVHLDSVLAPLYADLEQYLTVPLALLAGPRSRPEDTSSVAPYLQLASEARDVAPVGLFGHPRQVDFSLFAPRGHYASDEGLQRYFRAMAWLGLVDFRLVASQPDGRRTLQLEHLAAAALLRQCLDKAGQRPSWNEFDALFTILLGRSDNTTLSDLDRFMADANLAGPMDILQHPQPAELFSLLTTRDYGRQRIAGQVLAVSPEQAEPLAQPVSFCLLGQRFAVDAWLMSNVVFDRLLVDGKQVKRALPSPLDVMYVLGNDRAARHLKGELRQYGYHQNLAALRKRVQGADQSLWTDSVYNRWLGGLRKLNEDTTGERYPRAMRTAAWADKMLHTQLASWAQLRHDNILYTKQSVTMFFTCEYPAGYVEPYPAFYAALRDYAERGYAVFDRLELEALTTPEQPLRQQVLTYFQNLGVVAGRLQSLAEKELRQEPFSADDEAFIKNTAVRHVTSVQRGCAGPVVDEEWAGWYPSLFPWKDDSPALIADVHTNLATDRTSGLYPPRVLHAGTGPATAMFMLVDSKEGACLYVGPCFAYYEVVEPGFPPVRLTDQQWKDRLDTTPPPAPPEWTAGFRLRAAEKPQLLRLPPPTPGR